MTTQPEVATREPVFAPSGSVRVTAALAALLASASFVALAYVALHQAAGQRLDERAMNTVVAGRETHLAVLSVLGYVSIAAVIAIAVACVVLALLRGRIHLAIGALAIIGGANVSTQVLKHVVLDRAVVADGVLASNSFPSGHTTVVAAGVGALFLVSPRWLRPLVVPVGSFAITLTAASTVVAGWHRPSDVIAAVLICLAWTAGVSFLLGGEHERVAGTTLLAVLGAVAALVSLVVIGVRPSYGWSGFIEAAVVLSVVGGLTAASVALANHSSATS